MDDIRILPVPTRVLTDADDIVEEIAYYAGAKVTEDDLVCCAESVVAITQGRFVRPEELEISRAALFACRFIPDYGSLASPHGMQALMDVEGTWQRCFWGSLQNLSVRAGCFINGAEKRQPSLMM